jgi:hypothetical protein
VSKNGTPLAKISIKRLLTHRAYLGFVKHGDEWFDGNFEPIVTPALFEAVQKVLQTKERPRKRKIKHDFPFTGLFRCAECGSMISAQWATGKSGGRYRYYRCSKKRGHCSQAYLQESELTRQICARLQTISLCDRYTDWMLDKVKMWEREEIGASQSEVQNLSNRIKANEERMEKLLSAYLDGDVPKDVYLKRKDILMRSLAALRQKEKDFECAQKYWHEVLKMDQKNLSAYHGLASLAWANKDSNGAVKWLRQGQAMDQRFTPFMILNYEIEQTQPQQPASAATGS